MPKVSFEMKSLELLVVGFRVPLRGELYLDKDHRVQRLHEDRQQSRRARKRYILIEGKRAF